VVKPGEVLLEVDPTDYRLAVAEARRALELELARLGLKQLPAGEFSVEALPTVRRALATERNALARHERLRRLGVDGAASVEERQMAERDHAVALADYRVAVLEAEATLAAARHRAAVLDTAQQRLDDTRIVAPHPAGKNGDVEYVVCQRSVVEGEIVRNLPIGDNMTLFKLVIDRPLKLMATVPERHRARVRPGQPVTLEVEAYPGERFAGAVARVNPSVDRASRSFQIEVRVANADRRLSPGSFVRAAVQTGTDRAARLVPEEALVSFAGVSKVFVVKDNTAREVRVRPGVSVRKGDATARTYVEVEGDLPPGSLVVTSGQSKLFDGTPVHVRSTK